MCKQKYKCSFKYYIRVLLLFVHLITIFIILIFELSFQCILVCSYEMFIKEEKWEVWPQNLMNYLVILKRCQYKINNRFSFGNNTRFYLSYGFKLPLYYYKYIVTMNAKPLKKRKILQCVIRSEKYSESQVLFSVHLNSVQHNCGSKIS